MSQLPGLQSLRPSRSSSLGSPVTRAVSLLSFELSVLLPQLSASLLLSLLLLFLCPDHCPILRCGCCTRCHGSGPFPLLCYRCFCCWLGLLQGLHLFCRWKCYLLSVQPADCPAPSLPLLGVPRLPQQPCFCGWKTMSGALPQRQPSKPPAALPLPQLGTLLQLLSDPDHLFTSMLPSLLPPFPVLTSGKKKPLQKKSFIGTSGEVARDSVSQLP